MAKYDPLEQHLKSLPRDQSHRLGFAELERVLASRLPRSARSYQAWWANQRGPGHVQSNAWLNARYHTRDLDLRREAVTFEPVALPREPKLRQTIGPLTVDQARKGLALLLGVPESKIHIRIES